MADFNLTQTDQQVQNILNDAQDAMGAGAQTTLTTDYIMLKGTNGRYHKILKDSFTEAVRNVLAGLLVNNDKGTTISQIAAINSGDFGSVTPANLASLLGGLRVDDLTLETDPDTLFGGLYGMINIEKGTYASKLPYTATISTRGLMYASGNYNDGKYLQIIFRASVGEIYMRHKIGENPWGEWYKIAGTAVPST